jgi:hypothetical protein
VALAIILRRHAVNVWEGFNPGKDPNAPAGTRLDGIAMEAALRRQTNRFITLRSIEKSPSGIACRLSVLNRH